MSFIATSLTPTRRITDEAGATRGPEQNQRRAPGPPTNRNRAPWSRQREGAVRATAPVCHGSRRVSDAMPRQYVMPIPISPTNLLGLVLPSVSTLNECPVSPRWWSSPLKCRFHVP